MKHQEKNHFMRSIILCSDEVLPYLPYSTTRQGAEYYHANSK